MSNYPTEIDEVVFFFFQFSYQRSCFFVREVNFIEVARGVERGTGDETAGDDSKFAKLAGRNLLMQLVN